MCRAWVHRHLVGKHLVSHYHWRMTRSSLGSDGSRHLGLAVGSPAADLVLDNIEAVVRQSPFLCGLCRFYCNTSDVFRQHWASDMHRQMDCKVPARGYSYTDKNKYVYKRDFYFIVMLYATFVILR